MRVRARVRARVRVWARARVRVRVSGLGFVSLVPRRQAVEEGVALALALQG